MYDIDVDNKNGIITVSDKWDQNAEQGSNLETPYFNDKNDEYIVSISNLKNVKKFTKFEYNSIGLSDGKYLLPYYRISRDGINYTDWFNLTRDVQDFPAVDPKDPIYIDIKWKRVGTSDFDVIRLLEYRLEGVIERDEEILTDSATITIPKKSSKIIKSPYIYKVFDIEDIEIIPPMLENVIIKYRYSQDNSKTWSEWQFFNKENIITEDINPIRFFQIEYYIENSSDKDVKLQDINLIGNFQNIDKDYEKGNLMGIRENCISNKTGAFDENGNYIPNLELNDTGVEQENMGTFQSLSREEVSKLWNPYAQDEATKLYEKLSEDVEQMTGHSVSYFVTDPDKQGQDHVLHEYQLYNVVCSNSIKVSISGNQFPDSQIKMNVFDLELFDTMEAHITKKQFKKIFGKQRRPSKEDFLYFPTVSRMFIVDHAQQHRSFNNKSVYYKLILKKYNQKANVQPETTEIKNQMDKLTQNSTVEELMGDEQRDEQKAIANKKQNEPLTRDSIRLEYKATINKELIENSSTIISKSHYDLSSVNYSSTAVEYKKSKSFMRKSDNISFQFWFNINNYIEGEVYNFIEMYDEDKKIGYKINLIDDSFNIMLNSKLYEFKLTDFEPSQGDPTGLEEEVWYCYVLNINQRQKEIEHFVYRRNVEDEEKASQLQSTILKKEYYEKKELTELVEFEGLKSPKILGSDMKITNIRMFVDVLPENSHNKILNQYILGDNAKYLLFADNANTRLYLPNFPLFE